MKQKQSLIRPYVSDGGIQREQQCSQFRTKRANRFQITLFGCSIYTYGQYITVKLCVRPRAGKIPPPGVGNFGSTHGWFSVFVGRLERNCISSVPKANEVQAGLRRDSHCMNPQYININMATAAIPLQKLHPSPPSLPRSGKRK